MGDPTDDSTQMGPVVSDSAHRTISTGIDTATAQGASVLTGGRSYTDGRLADGYFIAPTIVELGGEPADIWTEELFGPVLAVKRAADADEAFDLANDSEFGLSAAVFTQDLTRALQAVEHIDVGVLHVNSESAGADPHVPFGGRQEERAGPQGTRRCRAGVLHAHHHRVPARRKAGRMTTGHARRSKASSSSTSAGCSPVRTPR